MYRILYRPVGPLELALIEKSNWKKFPPRLPEQSIFYPVLNEEYAIQIAKEWNLAASGSGFVTRFKVNEDFINKYELKTVGGINHKEFWIPSEDLEEFNNNIVGLIEIIHKFK